MSLRASAIISGASVAVFAAAVLIAKWLLP